MAWDEDILTILSSRSLGHRLMRRRIAGFPGREKKRTVSGGTLRVTLSRLKKRGLVQNKNGIWMATAEGLSFLSARLARKTNKKKTVNKNMIIAFDIPEDRRGARDWLRAELVAIGFSMLQKSLWLGPSPLPKKFVEDVARRGVIENLKFFEARETDIV